MNTLEAKLRAIMENALRDIVRAMQNSSVGEFGAVMRDEPGPSRSTREPQPSQPARPQTPQRRVERGKPPSRKEINTRVFEAIATAPRAISLGEIAKEIRLDPAIVAPSLRILRDEGHIEKHGDRRLARYTAGQSTQSEASPSVGDRVIDSEPEASGEEEEYTYNQAKEASKHPVANRYAVEGTK